MPSTPVYGLRYQSLTDPPDGASLGENLAMDVEAELVRIDAAAAVGTRIATNIRTSDSSAVTAESTADSVTASLVIGRTYLISWQGAVISSVAGDHALVRIREDDTTGTQLQRWRIHIPVIGGAGTRFGFHLVTQYTASATGNKTFVGTIARISGTGNITLDADALEPTYLYVDYVSG